MTRTGSHATLSQVEIIKAVQAGTKQPVGVMQVAFAKAACSK